MAVLFPCALALIGVGILEFGGLDPPRWIDMVVCVAPVCFALNFWRSEHYAELYSNDVLAFTGVILCTTTGISFIICIILQVYPGSTSSMEWSDLMFQLLYWKISLPLLFTGILTTAWTSYTEQRVLKTLPASEITVIYSLEPLFATLFSHILLDEELTWETLVGALFIILACMWKPVLYPVYRMWILNYNTSVNNNNNNNNNNLFMHHFPIAHCVIQEYISNVLCGKICLGAWSSVSMLVCKCASMCSCGSVNFSNTNSTPPSPSRTATAASTTVTTISSIPSILFTSPALNKNTELSYFNMKASTDNYNVD